MGDTPEPMDPEEAAEEIKNEKSDSDTPYLIFLSFLLLVVTTLLGHAGTSSWMFAISFGLLLSTGIMAVVVSVKYKEASGRFYKAIGVALLGGDFKKNDPSAVSWMSKDKYSLVGKLGCLFGFLFCGFFLVGLFAPETGVDDTRNEINIAQNDVGDKLAKEKKKESSDTGKQQNKQQETEKKTENPNSEDDKRNHSEELNKIEKTTDNKEGSPSNTDDDDSYDIPDKPWAKDKDKWLEMKRKVERKIRKAKEAKIIRNIEYTGDATGLVVDSQVWSELVTTKKEIMCNLVMAKELFKSHEFEDPNKDYHMVIVFDELHNRLAIFKPGWLSLVN